ncbi:selenide, water dikinase SelD [Sulfitobacter sp. M57]|uniref:selenide, water dikinase SelD n=1 Tax=unclassified Sulfitobacter TaxID=196795 RepID=UPI0023E34090|nr:MULTISPECIES: selenide, water dikinase SelD [unclassified Sulfitobacter]MDF3433207.1 selenide, water dikinase SelD [Sulfitobacter sp. KE42]MDF3513302.1 selenide, water dikinase SelD [Sulfitobacter sp. M36]MDF3521095.1 selenide, water dikinase SelD [Sulfitobacter sp. M74]MDF3525000.1 selenide, water dikinase SelD [Sulfitobacter sp. S66]MDF3532808.1 selenide, water dikinase SelD [Sulfitobacter sp. S62]MDF3540618.1 selenide, water dikinase SelD [Sulfitobacter sp. M62]MDF3544522.1 selenide, w
MLSPVPYTRDLVLVGGGHAHALVLRSWGMDRLAGARVTVINPGPTAPYTGMLPGHIAGHYGRDELEIDLVRLCRHAGARLILDKAVGIDRDRREVILEGRGPVAYDVASVDVGITAEMDLPGFAEHGIGAKPLDRYAACWREFLARVAAGEVAPDVAVIGGGVAGCELAMAMAFALRGAGVAARVTVIEAGRQISGMGAAARRRMLSVMAGLGVEVRVAAQVLEVAADRVVLADQPAVPAAFCVGAAGAFPHRWIAKTDLPQRDGFIEVGADLAVRGDAALFAVGDCAVMPHAPRPKAGVFAVRAAPVLHHNLRAALSGGRRKTWKPQKHYLKLISLGDKSAMAENFGLSLAGPLLWRWKDRIDRKFMDRLADLPTMAVPAVTGELAAGVSEILAAKPLCGGCGAKVGRGVLSGGLQGIAAVRGDVVTGAGDDAAVLRQPGGGFQVLSTDHLRALIEDPAQMARIAAVHALGDIWAMGAQPQVALAQIVVPQMAAALQERSLREVTQQAEAVFQAAGAQLVGGHTTMGAELTIGFTVTGTRAEMPLTVAGAQNGDVLILTRPIGSGVILAADMAGQADGRDVAAALEVMGQSQHRAAAVLAGVAHAMTDVTGFGLAGHVQAICAASGMDAVLWRDKIPVYAGARALSDAGVSSTLMPSNRVDAPVSGQDDPLLFDPQTAGGLLAAVPEAQADEVLADLGAQGCVGYKIGALSQGSGRITLIASGH